jgi:hypothetical protein
MRQHGRSVTTGRSGARRRTRGCRGGFIIMVCGSMVVETLGRRKLRRASEDDV